MFYLLKENNNLRCSYTRRKNKLKLKEGKGRLQSFVSFTKEKIKKTKQNIRGIVSICSNNMETTLMLVTVVIFKKRIECSLMQILI